jgi:hypothetical protein
MSSTQYILARLIPFAQTYANWVASDPIPAQNEVVVETGTNPATYKMKIGDGVHHYSVLPYVGSVPAGSESLQDVLNVGNVADSTSGGVSSFTLMDIVTTLIQNQSSILIEDSSLHSTLAFFGIDPADSKAKLIIRDQTTGSLGEIMCGALTATRKYLLPDEGNAVPGNDEIVLHKTKQSISVSSSGIASNYNNNGITSGDGTTQIVTDVLSKVISLTLNTGAYIQMVINAGVPTLEIRDSASSFYSQIFANSLSANRTNKTPDRSGTFQLAGDQIPPTVTVGVHAGVGATCTITDGDDRSGVIILTTGSSGVTGAVMATIAFHQAYPNKTRVLIGAADDATAAIMTSSQIYAQSNSTSQFLLYIPPTGTTFGTGLTFKFTYIVQD